MQNTSPEERALTIMHNNFVVVTRELRMVAQRLNQKGFSTTATRLANIARVTMRYADEMDAMIVLLRSG